MERAGSNLGLWNVSHHDFCGELVCILRQEGNAEYKQRINATTFRLEFYKTRLCYKRLHFLSWKHCEVSLPGRSKGFWLKPILPFHHEEKGYCIDIMMGLQLNWARVDKFVSFVHSYEFYDIVILIFLFILSSHSHSDASELTLDPNTAHTVNTSLFLRETDE